MGSNKQCHGEWRRCSKHIGYQRTDVTIWVQHALVFGGTSGSDTVPEGHCVGDSWNLAPGHTPT